MSLDIFVQIRRAGVQVQAKVAVQLDDMSVQEASYYGGVADYQRYNGYVLANMDIRQGDLLIDLSNVDPRTGSLTQYRVVESSEQFPDQHTELVCDLVRGT